jgi:hypothetical protein
MSSHDVDAFRERKSVARFDPEMVHSGPVTPTGGAKTPTKNGSTPTESFASVRFGQDASVLVHFCNAAGYATACTDHGHSGQRRYFEALCLQVPPSTRRSTRAKRDT